MPDNPVPNLEEEAHGEDHGQREATDEAAVHAPGDRGVRAGGSGLGERHARRVNAHMPEFSEQDRMKVKGGNLVRLLGFE